LHENDYINDNIGVDLGKKYETKIKQNKNPQIKKESKSDLKKKYDEKIKELKVQIFENIENNNIREAIEMKLGDLYSLPIEDVEKIKLEDLFKNSNPGFRKVPEKDKFEQIVEKEKTIKKPNQTIELNSRNKRKNLNLGNINNLNFTDVENIVKKSL
jgi:hypothetical protein